VHTAFKWGNLRGKYHLEDSGVDGKLYIKMDVQEMEWEGTGAGLIWLRTGTGGGLL
jgi:hypothetical protein